MKINKLELNNNRELNNNIVQEKNQKIFLESMIGKSINTAVDIGIRTLLPDFLDEQIINIKDNLLNYGLKEGIKQTINNGINLGKSAIGVFTGNFENISQMQEAVANGGIIDGMSSLLDAVVNKVEDMGIIDKKVANTIKNGKDIVLNNIESNIEKSFKMQLTSIENIDKYISNWKNDFKRQDFNLMEKSYKKIEKEIKNLIPLEKTLTEARIIENLHNLIKNNGQNFNLTEEQLQLSEKLIYI